MSIKAQLATSMEFPILPVEVTAHVFTLTASEDGAHAGRAVVYADARYISISLRGAPRLVRRFATAREWPELEQLLPGLVVGHVVERGSVLGGLIAIDLSVTVDAQLAALTTLTCTAGETTSQLDSCTSGGSAWT